MASKTLKRLILVVSNKGGVGKSVVSRTLAEIFRSSGKTAHLWDTDGGVGALILSYGSKDKDGEVILPQDPSKGVDWYDIRTDGGQDSDALIRGRNFLTDSLAAGAPVVLHDMAGGSIKEIQKIMDDGEGVDSFMNFVESMGYRLTLVHVVSNSKGSTLSVGEYLDLFGNRADHIVALNRNYGKKDTKFPWWFGWETARGVKQGGSSKEALSSLGGSVIDFPKLDEDTFVKFDPMEAPFSAGVEHPDLSVTERHHINQFLVEAKKAFATVSDKIGL